MYTVLPVTGAYCTESRARDYQPWFANSREENRALLDVWSEAACQVHTWEPPYL